MAVFQVKKYKIKKDENGNNIQVPKTKEEWNKETKGGTATWYFVDRYILNEKTKQYMSAKFNKKCQAEADRALFLLDPIKYILEHSKKAKNRLTIKQIDSGQKKLNDYFNDFIDYDIEFVKESTIHEYKSSWNNHLHESIGILTPSQITLANTQDWHKKMNKKINPITNTLYSTNTKNKIHSALTEFYQYLYSNGLIELNYAKVVGGFKDPTVNKNKKKEIKFQTMQQYDKFMSIVDDEFWYALFNFCFWHGPRIGEQRALKIKDIDLNSDTIRFHKTFSRDKNGKEIIGSIKNGKERTTYLATQSKPHLEKLINQYKQMDDYTDDWFLFGGPFSISKNSIQRKLDEYYTKLKSKYPTEVINSLTHHEFGRHSHASLLLNIGSDRGDIYQIIAERLGDTTEVIRSTYAHPYESLNINKSKMLLNSNHISQKLNLKGENVI